MPDISLGRLFLAFLRLGATAYGGPAMMAHLKGDLVGKRRWLSDQEFKEGMALCQVIPGATMVQMCTYTGYRLRSIRGALMAAVGFVLPAFLTMTVLTALYFRAGSLPVVQALFRGLGALVIAIVLNACLTLGRTTLQGWQGVLLAALALVAMLLRVNFLIVLVGAAALAIPLYRYAKARGTPGPEAIR
ncbi:MAG TPA: chromate transporter [Candidatus Methylomirabilis sp.]|nr:chromate transporter [Candidatus Methylomirabilis sp.]